MKLIYALAHLANRKISMKYRRGGRKSIASEISAANLVAMKRADFKCEITGKRGSLRRHHLFDVSTYPFLAAKPWNIFILKMKLHDAFHSWMGGTAVSCTIFDFWKWRYFVLQWWKGYLFLTALLAGLAFWLFVLD